MKEKLLFNKTIGWNIWWIHEIFTSILFYFCSIDLTNKFHETSELERFLKKLSYCVLGPRNINFSSSIFTTLAAIETLKDVWFFMNIFLARIPKILKCQNVTKNDNFLPIHHFWIAKIESSFLTWRKIVGILFKSYQ